MLNGFEDAETETKRLVYLFGLLSSTLNWVVPVTEWRPFTVKTGMCLRR